MITAQDRIDALRATPCGTRLLDVLGDAGDVWLVGGAVRDLLLGGAPVELDLVTLRDAEDVAAVLGDVTAAHGRFGTATAAHGPCLFDVARARTESYATPGALPIVADASVEQDLLRRDFTVNAIAMSMTGELVSAGSAMEDLEARTLRILHDGSFIDDPTRLWRLVRYSTRLGFAVEPRTAELATAAVADGELQTVSGDRIGAELRLALREPDPLAALHAAKNLGLVDGVRLDPARTQRALSLLPPGARADLAVLGAALTDISVVEPLGFTAAEIAILRRCVEIEPLAEEPPSVVAARLRGEPVEAIAIAGADGSATTAERWLLQWREVELEIDGEDLIAAGVPQGPEIGERLRRALDRKLDGEISGREEELAAALE